MNYQFRSAMLAFSLCAGAYAMKSNAESAFFPQADLMRVGVYYYPEAWPSNQWARDIANIKKMNLEFVHMGEFAWAFMEPEEGRFDFDWLERNVQLCADRGLKVILCTPTPTPPVWLVEKHPEVLMVDAQGRRMQHGTRQQACWSVETYRQYVAKIVNELGRRFGNNPAVWGWQLDNELSHYGKEPCYCDACQAKFRAWLKKKYGAIEALNRDWGNAFWSQMYQNFDQIRIPNQAELVAQINPHALLDSQRWFAEEAADYLRFQTGILRQYCGNRQWITTNFMHNFAAVDPVLSGKDFEIITWTHYPAHGNPNEGPLGFRMGSAAEMSFSHDFLRSINGAEGLMELQPGQVNWGEVNPQPYPGAVHLWIMRAFAAGAKLSAPIATVSRCLAPNYITTAWSGPTELRRPPAANNTRKRPAKWRCCGRIAEPTPKNPTPTPPDAPHCFTTWKTAGTSTTTSRPFAGTQWTTPGNTTAPSSASDARWMSLPRTRTFLVTRS